MLASVNLNCCYRRCGFGVSARKCDKAPHSNRGWGIVDQGQGQGQGLIRNYAVSDPGEKESLSAIWPELVEN